MFSAQTFPFPESNPQTISLQSVNIFSSASLSFCTLRFSSCSYVWVYVLLHLVCLQGGFDACRIYDLNYTSEGIRDAAERGGTVACRNWEYSREVFTENIVTEVSISLKKNSLPIIDGDTTHKFPESISLPAILCVVMISTFLSWWEKGNYAGHVRPFLSILKSNLTLVEIHHVRNVDGIFAKE